MSRTARCLFALGLSVSLAAACGDDDGDLTNIGGTGGGGSGGTAGTAGRGGTGGGGTAGTSGVAGGGTGGGGTGGTAGIGGTAGTAGTGGTGGTAGGDVPDAGPDADVGDADVGDAGGTCPGDTSGAITSTGTQEVIITALVFDEEDDTVTVTLRGALVGGFDFGDPLLLCTGSEPEDCDEDVQALPTLALGQEATITIDTGLVTAEAGELALINGLPTSPDAGNPDPIIRAYVNWGEYQSLDPDNGAVDDLETRADEQEVWTAGESVDVGDNTVIFANGDVTSADGFAACTPE
jgi:hypothetical protein